MTQLFEVYALRRVGEIEHSVEAINHLQYNNNIDQTFCSKYKVAYEWAHNVLKYYLALNFGRSISPSAYRKTPLKS